MTEASIVPLEHCPAFSRVLVTGDLLRPFPAGRGMESTTRKNIRWLQHLLAAPLRAAGHAPRALAWDERASPDGSDWFDTPALYHALGMDLTHAHWAQLANLTHAPAPLLDALHRHAADALVVGYELPPVMIDALQQLGRPFVDLVLHPVRYLPDLGFALRTNVVPWHAQLQAQRADASEYALQAGLILAKAAWMPPPMPLPPGTALVLGQVASDRAAARPDGSFASLAQHIEALHGLCCTHPLVVYRPHPYAGADDPSLQAVARLPAIRATQHNYYHLLAQPQVTRVVAINSSGLVEARHFGREATNLEPFLYDFDAADAPGALVPLTSAWATPEFWRQWLAPRAEAVRLPGLPAGTLRRAMNADWGYGFIERMCA